MSKQVDFYFDVGSPTTYLAWTQMPWLENETGAEIVYKPILLGGVFEATGNRGPALLPAKGAYMFKDMARCAKAYGVPLTPNPNFPINTLPLQRAAVAMLGTEQFSEYLRLVYDAMWINPKNLNDPNEINTMLVEGGFEPQEIIATINQQAVKDRLKSFTKEAVERGAFGAPTFFVCNEMFFGQDRLEFVRDALNA